MMPEISTKPYLIRAIYEWCTDNGYTPYLASAVDAHTVVPNEFVKNGEIVLNISFTATSGLKLGNERIEFHARFGGVSREISVSVSNVVAIYARENGQGMAFELTPIAPEDEDVSSDVDAPAQVGLSAVPVSEPAKSTSSDDGPNGDDNPPKKSGRPALTRVK